MLNSFKLIYLRYILIGRKVGYGFAWAARQCRFGARAYGENGLRCKKDDVMPKYQGGHRIARKMDSMHKLRPLHLLFAENHWCFRVQTEVPCLPIRTKISLCFSR